MVLILIVSAFITGASAQQLMTAHMIGNDGDFKAALRLLAPAATLTIVLAGMILTGMNL